MTNSTTQMITMPEGKTLEFKRDISSSKNILKTLVAFANTAGGRLVIGVEDESREVLGVKDPLDGEERICNLIADSIKPRLVPNVDLISIEDKTLLRIEVYPSGLRPHWLKKEGPNEGVYVRLGSTNRKADRELVAELHRSVSGVPFDEMSMPDLSPDDLDLDAAKKSFKGIRELNEEELITLKLLSREQDRLVPTTGAVLLFGKKRDFHFSDAWIQCGRFIGKDKADIFDHIDIHEHLPVAVEKVMEFLKKHAMRGADFSELRRKDVWSIPLTILREAVVNAVVHADYSQRGAPIRIAFFDDRIEIENPGILLPGMTVEDMLQGVSKIRNHVIARVFRELDLIEQWGSGVRRMFKEAEALGLPKPEIIEVGMRVRFIINLEKSIVLPHKMKTSKDQVGTKKGLSRDQVGTKLKPNLEQINVLHASANESGITELMNVAGRSNRTKFRNQVLNPLLSDELIEMTQPDSPKSPTQKYRLTNKGKDFLAKAYQDEME